MPISFNMRLKMSKNIKFKCLKTKQKYSKKVCKMVSEFLSSVVEFSRGWEKSGSAVVRVLLHILKDRVEHRLSLVGIARTEILNENNYLQVKIEIGLTNAAKTFTNLESVCQVAASLCWVVDSNQTINNNLGGDKLGMVVPSCRILRHPIGSTTHQFKWDPAPFTHKVTELHPRHQNREFRFSGRNLLPLHLQKC
jgi:hypothetical protein